MGLVFSLCPGSICGYDVDDLFAYSTIKRVTIRDARLGGIFYLLTFCIAVYILIYQLVWQGGYLSFATPSNAVRVTLQQPTTSADGEPCNPNKASCFDNFTSPSALPYCWEPNRTSQRASGGSGGEFKTWNCSYMDGAEVAVIRADSILMTTAVHAYSQHVNPQCDSAFGSRAAPSCSKLWQASDDTLWYVVDPERFTLLIDHAVTTPTSQQQLDPRSDFVGYLYVDGGSQRQDDFCKKHKGVSDFWSEAGASFAPCYVPPSRVGASDFFSIGFLLDSMGMALDESVVDDGEGPEPQLRRYAGMIVTVAIEYHNFRAFHLGVQKGVRYVYKLQAIPGSSYKETRIVTTDYPTKRVKQDLHGILFELQASGQLATFDFTNMLIQLTTSLALLAVATTVVNLLAQYVLKYSPFYKRAMYTTSPDFSDLRAANHLTDDELQGHLRHMSLSTRGDRVSQIMRLLSAGWTEHMVGLDFDNGSVQLPERAPTSFSNSSVSASASIVAAPQQQRAAASSPAPAPSTDAEKGSTAKDAFLQNQSA